MSGGQLGWPWGHPEGDLRSAGGSTINLGDWSISSRQIFGHRKSGQATVVRGAGRGTRRCGFSDTNQVLWCRKRVQGGPPGLYTDPGPGPYQPGRAEPTSTAALALTGGSKASPGAQPTHPDSQDRSFPDRRRSLLRVPVRLILLGAQAGASGSPSLLRPGMAPLCCESPEPRDRAHVRPLACPWPQNGFRMSPGAGWGCWGGVPPPSTDLNKDTRSQPGPPPCPDKGRPYRNRGS